MPVATSAGLKFLSIGVPLDRLNEILLQQRLPKSWIISLLDSSGTIVARTQKFEEFLGKKATPGLVEALRQSGEGAAEIRTLEGLEVVAAFSRSGISGWTAVIGIPSSELAAPLRHTLYTIGAAAAVLLLAGLVLSAHLARRIEQPIQALVASALALGRGESVSLPPLRLREAQQLGRALLAEREQQHGDGEQQRPPGHGNPARDSHEAHATLSHRGSEGGNASTQRAAAHTAAARRASPPAVGVT